MVALGRNKKKNNHNNHLVKKIVDNKLIQGLFILGVILSLKIIIVQLMIVIKKLNGIDDKIFLIDEFDEFDEFDEVYETMEDLKF